MPRLNGTAGSDDIEVTNDSGTLNGNPVGSPIDNVRGRSGDDQIVITNSTIANTGQGNTGNVVGNAGNDTIIVSNSVIGGRIASGADDDTVEVSGSTVQSIQLGGGDDTLTVRNTTINGVVVGGGGDDTLILPEGTIVDDNFLGTFPVQAGVTYPLTSGTFLLPSSGFRVPYSSFETAAGFPCFTYDTLIATDQGLCKIQNVRPGDLVQTVGNGAQPVRWTGRRAFTTDHLDSDPKLRPVRILAGALAQGMPNRDLLVSRQHRMLVQSKIAQRMFGTPEVLIPAIRLTSLPGIYVDHEVQSVEYFHLLFDKHEIIYAEGAPTESLYTGPEALKSLGTAAQREIFKIFPELADHDHSPDPARLIPRGKQQTQLISRHSKNDKPLLHERFRCQ